MHQRLLRLKPALRTSARRYLPGHPEDVRARVQKDWLQQLGAKEYDVCRFMSSESEMLRWKAEGLPGDVLSMQVGRWLYTCSAGRARAGASWAWHQHSCRLFADLATLFLSFASCRTRWSS